MSKRGHVSEAARRQEEAVDELLAAVDYDSAPQLEEAASRVRALAERLAKVGHPAHLLDALAGIDAELRATAREAAVREFDYDSAFSEEERAALDALAARQVSDLRERQHQAFGFGQKEEV